MVLRILRAGVVSTSAPCRVGSHQDKMDIQVGTSFNMDPLHLLGEGRCTGQGILTHLLWFLWQAEEGVTVRLAEVLAECFKL